jgi:hypothetical protein
MTNKDILEGLESVKTKLDSFITLCEPWLYSDELAEAEELEHDLAKITAALKHRFIDSAVDCKK